MFSKQIIEKYFIAEKQLGLLFSVAGAVAILIAILCYAMLKTNFCRGAALPLLIVGMLELIAGMSVYRRSDNDRISNVYAFDMEPGKLKSQELPRMRAVVRNFSIIKPIELALALTGIVLFLYFRNDAVRAFWGGFGLALLLQSLLTFAADYSADKRAKVYLSGLISFTEMMRVQELPH